MHIPQSSNVGHSVSIKLNDNGLKSEVWNELNGNELLKLSVIVPLIELLHSNYQEMDGG